MFIGPLVSSRYSNQTLKHGPCQIFNHAVSSLTNGISTGHFQNGEISNHRHFWSPLHACWIRSVKSLAQEIHILKMSTRCFWLVMFGDKASITLVHIYPHSSRTFMENFYTHSPRSNILTASTLSDMDYVVWPSEIRFYSQIFIWDKNFPVKRKGRSNALGWHV